MYKSPINYKTGQCLKDKSTGFIYQISCGGIHGVYIKKEFKDFYLLAEVIEEFYEIWVDEDEDKYKSLLNNFKKYYLDEQR